MSDYYKIGDFARKIGVSIQTLRNWDKDGSLKPAKVTNGGTRYYSEEQYVQYSGLNKNIEKHIVAYSVNNMSLLEQYLVAKGYKYKIVIDAVNIISLVETNSVERVIFYSRDDITIDGIEPLTDSAYRLFKTVCKSHGVAIEFVKEVI